MKNKDTLKYIVFIIIASIITMIPMFINDYYNGHDTKFYIANIESITELFRSGNFNYKILGNMANNFGYGIGLFYSPFSSVITSLINLIINNTLFSIKIVYFFGLLISGLSMFFLSKKISKSDEIGFLSAIIYMVFPYHISNIYIRDAQNESMLFAFLPLIISGIYELFKNDNKKKFYILFIGGYILSLLSCLTLTLYFTVMLLIFLIFKYKETIKNIKQIIIAIIFILFITSFFLVPLLEQMIFGNYRVFQDGVMVQGTWGNALSIFDYINLSVNWKDSSIKFFIDAITLILLNCTLFSFKKIENKSYKYILIFGIITAILSSKIFPWDILPKSLRIMQFPWKFVGFVSISVSLIAPLCLSSFKDKKTISIILCIALILLSQPLLHSFSSEVITLDKIDYSIGEGNNKEYLPVNLYNNIDYYNNRSNEIISEDDVIIISDTSKLEFSVNTSSLATLELPRIYYVGYKLSDENKNEYKIYENSNGFIETVLPEGIYTLEYTGTDISKACNIISIVFLLGYIVLCFKKY